MTDRPDAVTWSRRASASTVGRCCLYLQVGFVGGITLLVIVLVVAALGLTAVDGAYGQLALLVLFLLIGGPFSLLYVLPLVDDDTARSSIRTWTDRAGYDRLRPLPAAVSVLAGAVTIVGSGAVSPVALLALFLSILAGTSIGTQLVTSWGEIDPEAGTVRVNDQSFGLEELAAVGVHRLPGTGTVVLRLSYATKTRGVTAPGYVSMPRDVYEEARPLLEAATRGTQPTSRQSRIERVLLVVFGVGALVGAVGAAVLGFERGGDARVILSYVALLAGCFGVGFLALAAPEP
ncbi:hypothetical protein [Natrinema caseinilyticum]|uniref:hypothetical protein n=1 Tax=Natrinema caseinilyticum TaxID=2961570 RepID=UPI0020C52FBF|nr:hypothetical protein [Natrinema caseinilyticum]